MLKRVVTFGVLAASLCLSWAASARSSRETNWDVAQGRLVGPPVMAVVAVREQRVTIYDDRGPILSAPVSTGRKDYDTPVGSSASCKRKPSTTPIATTMPQCRSCSGLHGPVLRSMRVPYRVPLLPTVAYGSPMVLLKGYSG